MSGSLVSAATACAFLASVLGFVSISASHTALGAALALLIAARQRLRCPPILLPLGLFLSWTVISALASGDAAEALPQIKKFYVFAMLPVLYTLFSTAAAARRLTEGWFVAGFAASLAALVQFGKKWFDAREAGEPFLTAYTPDRITGFFSHWMTFSQALLIICLMGAAFLLFSRSARQARGLWTAVVAVVGAALVLSFTRSVWLGGAAGLAYLLARWRPRLLWGAPILLIAALALAPQPLRQRLRSIADPGANQARLIMWRTGVNMIAARPLVGVGPEHISPDFRRYMPADVHELPPAFYGHLHNMYVHYAAERGVPALVALVWLLGKILLDWVRALRRLGPERSDRRFLLEGGVAAVAGIAIVGLFDVTLGDCEVLGAFLGLTAVGYRGAESRRLE